MSEIPMRTLDALPLHPGVPDVSDDYGVVVVGAVRVPRTFRQRDLAAFAWTALREDFECIKGWRVPDVRWHGVALRTVLEAVGADPDAECIEVGAGDYTTLLSREDAARALLALWLDDAPLPVEHGGPVRLLVPGSTCSTSVKWVDRINVRRGTPFAAVRALAASIAGTRAES